MILEHTHLSLSESILKALIIMFTDLTGLILPFSSTSTLPQLIGGYNNYLFLASLFPALLSPMILIHHVSLNCEHRRNEKAAFPPTHHRSLPPMIL